MAKIFGVFSLTIFLMIGIVGCSTNDDKTEEEIRDEVRAELEAEQDISDNDFVKWSMDDILATFLQSKVEYGAIYEMTAEDFGMAPMLATEAHRILIPSLGEDKGGRLFLFDNQADLETTKSYYDDLGESSTLLYSWTIVRDNVLLQINGDMLKEQMLTYEQALYEMEK